MENQRVKLGLVGAGYVATYHARALRTLPFVDIVGIADPDEDRAGALAEQFKIPKLYPSLKAMAEAEPTVIHILTPPGLHAPLALQALEMGCHVFVEKPMAESVADCDRMIASARQKGLVLSVNHSARMDPIVLQALDMIQKGACGQVQAVDFFRSSDYQAYSGGSVPAHFRNGSYPFQDLGVHGLYLLEAFLGPIRHADTRYYASGIGDPNLVFDEWRTMVETDKGTGQMYISWNVRPIQNELIIHGTKGVMHVDCYLQVITLRKTYPAPKPVQRILGAGFNSLHMLAKVSANTVRFATGNLKPSPGIHVSVIKFHQALHDGQDPPVPPEEGRRIIAMLEDVSRRADEDKRLYLTEPNQHLKPRILVTGANGFLGRALVDRLRAELHEPLRLLVRRPPSTPPPDDIHLVFGDLGNPAVVDRAMEGIETVFHLGAAMKGGPFEYQSGTIWGTRNVVDACDRHAVHRLVHVSSLSVLDHAGHPEGVAVNEASPYEPHPKQRGLYTQTKLEAEKMVLDAAAAQRIHAVVLRPGQIYGPGTEKIPPSGAINIAGRWLIVGSGNHHVPLVYVDNVVDALLLAATVELRNGAVFQLVDPQGITQRSYVNYAKRARGSRVRASFVAPWLLKFAGFGVELLGKVLKRPVPLTPYRVQSITPLWPCDCTAAHTVLGWRPRVSIQEGMVRTYPE